MSTNSSVSVIPKILKLYDMIDEHKIPNNEQLTKVLEQIIVSESDKATMESVGSNSQEKELLQLRKFHNNAKESCMEQFRLLHSHLELLLERPGSMGGYERAFPALFGQDVQTFTGTMILNFSCHCF